MMHLGDQITVFYLPFFFSQELSVCLLSGPVTLVPHNSCQLLTVFSLYSLIVPVSRPSLFLCSCSPCCE